MHEIRFNMGPSFRLMHERELVGRIARIVTPDGSVFEKNANCSRWQLGTANNWFISRDCKVGEYCLAYRYSGGSNIPNMEALRTAIIWLLDVEKFNTVSPSH